MDSQGHLGLNIIKSADNCFQGLHTNAVYPTIVLSLACIQQVVRVNITNCGLAITSALVLITKRKNYHE